MNTFFTVWFLINGAWISNSADGWHAIDKGTAAGCQAALAFANRTEAPSSSTRVKYTCEKDGAPRKVLTI